METGASISLRLAQGGVSGSQVCGGEGGQAALAPHVPPGLVGIKLPPTLQLAVSFLGELWERTEEGVGMWVWGAGRIAPNVSYVPTVCQALYQVLSVPMLRYAARCQISLIPLVTWLSLSIYYGPGSVCSRHWESGVYSE